MKRLSMASMFFLLSLVLYGNVTIDENVWHAFVLTIIVTGFIYGVQGTKEEQKKSATAPTATQK